MLLDIYHVDKGRTGAHLETCKNFQCNIHFKCPQFYCIPWLYVCDNKWDCPYGNDEDHKHSCGAQRNCQYMFRCRQSKLCLHVANVCDGSFECPQNDDELLCQISNFMCPTKCVCLNFAIFCQNKSHFDPPGHYISYHITYSSVNRLFFLGHSPFAIVLYFVGNNVSDLCSATALLHHISFVNFASNKITVISKLCFNNLHYLHKVILTNNNLEQMDKEAFVNVSKMSVFDMSHNKLTVFESTIFYNVSKLSILNISDNPLTQVAPGMLENLKTESIVVDVYYICCVKPKKSFCQVTKQSVCKNCAKIFSTGGMKDTALTIILLIMFINIINLYIHRYRSSSMEGKDTQSNPNTFRLQVSALSAGNLSWSFFLSILVINHSYFENNIIQKEREWSKSSSCFVAYITCLLHTLSAAYFLCLISFSRLMVVLYPLTSQFKSTGFVKRNIAYSVLFMAVICACTVPIIWNRSQNVAETLCSPLVDPSKMITTKKVTATFIMVCHIIVGIVMFVLYLSLQTSLKISQKQFQSKSHNHPGVAMKLYFLAISNLTFWGTSSVTYVVVIFHVKPFYDLISWNTIVTASLPSLCNPLFFIPFHSKEVLVLV